MPYKNKIIANEHGRIYQKNWKLNNWPIRPWLRLLASIKARCHNKKHHYFKRGIKNFLTENEIKSIWLRDNAYSLKKPSIDRIDGNGNYTKDNCRIIELSDNLHRRKKCTTPALIG